MLPPDPSGPRLLQKLAKEARHRNEEARPKAIPTPELREMIARIQLTTPSASTQDLLDSLTREPPFLSPQDRTLAYIEVLSDTATAALAARTAIAQADVTAHTAEQLAPLAAAYDNILALTDTRWLSHARTHAEQRSTQINVADRYATLTKQMEPFHNASLALTEYHLSTAPLTDADTRALHQTQDMATQFAIHFLTAAGRLPTPDRSKTER